MKYYSEKLCRTYDTVEACLAAEEEFEAKEKAKKDSEKEIKEAEANLHKAYEAYRKVLKKYNKDCFSIFEEFFF